MVRSSIGSREATSDIRLFEQWRTDQCQYDRQTSQAPLSRNKRGTDSRISRTRTFRLSFQDEIKVLSSQCMQQLGVSEQGKSFEKPKTSVQTR